MPDGSSVIKAGNYTLKPKGGLTYETFLKEMKEVCKILGPGSDFTAEAIKNSAVVEMTYEDALEEYHNLLEKDGLTGGYAKIVLRLYGNHPGDSPGFL